MESNNEFEELILKIAYVIILMTFNIQNKSPCSMIPLRIISDKIDGFIRKYDRTKYLQLFHSNKKI